MMTTPICDFLEKYKKSDAARLHMPGHKGISFLGCEEYDITEISGADSLYEASGIIEESERNASDLFGANSFYSAEGSSLCIRAMVYLLRLYGCKKIYAARNAHRAFITACALNGIEPIWLYPKDKRFLSGLIDKESVENALSNETEKSAVFLTSPDYLGSICDIGGISSVCKRQGALLFVDNAHGAYLKFLGKSLHPIDLGADVCCDSAHKTLPVLTGGAYLHISHSAPKLFKENAKNALALFGSTSPSYLILASLDKANEYISNGYKNRLEDFTSILKSAKERLEKAGYDLVGDEPLKIVIKPKKYGYYGTQLAQELERNGIYTEFSDRDHTVLMLTPENGARDVERAVKTLTSFEKRAPINENAPKIPICESAMPMREALYAESERVLSCESEGRIIAQFNVACPPAVPISVLGERICKDALKCFEYYGIDSVSVVKK